jgi:hypothetical protein
MSFDLISSVEKEDKYGKYRHYFCDICNCELAYGSYYCIKCNNISHPCEDCQIDEKFVKTIIIAYKTKSQPDNYYKLYKDNVILSNLTTFISKCPKCGIIENPINCSCEGSCNCVSLGKYYDVEDSKNMFKDGFVPFQLLPY